MDCNAANFLLHQEMKRLGAPPFLGLLDFPATKKPATIMQCREALGGRVDNIPSFFQRYSYLSGWLVAHGLHDSYGEDGSKIYPIIGEVLGVSLEVQSTHRILREAYLKLCERLGFPSRGFERPSYLYLVHAGVSQAQLHHLISAFMRQREVFGDPPRDSTVLLNRWEDDSLDFMPSAVVAPRLPILWDETAWHASLFARIVEAPESFEPKTPQEKIFFDCYKEIKPRKSRSTLRSVSPPKPRLLWGEEGLMLRLPRTEGQIPVQLDDRSVKFRGGEDRLLEQPWPRRLRFEIDGSDIEMQFLADENRFAIFDRTLGTLLEDRPASSPATLELDTTNAAIVARRMFDVDGQEAFPIGDDCFVLLTGLSSQPKELKFGDRCYGLQTKPRRRLILSGGEIAGGNRGKLYGRDASILVETGLDACEIRKVRVTCGGKSKFADVVIESGNGSVTLGDVVPEGLSRDPQRLQLELMAPFEGEGEPRSAGIEHSAWIWPGFVSMNGLELVSGTTPDNFLEDQSSNVHRSPAGLHLEAEGGYQHAAAVFEIGVDVVAFRLPWPDVVIQRCRPEGSRSLVQIGARISVGVADRHGQISIRCPDRKAALRVGNRHEQTPFALGMTRTIAISDLLKPDQSPSVVLERSSGAEALLFEIVDVLEPVRFEVRSNKDGLDVALALGTPVDAIGIESEDEFGMRELHEVSLGHVPSEKAPPDWLSARHAGDDPCELRVFISERDTEGLHIGRFFIRPTGAPPNQGWRPVRNARGDAYALPLTAQRYLAEAPTDHVKKRFGTLSRWMSDCYADECWYGHGLERILPGRWRRIGETVPELTLGVGILIEASLAAAPDETSPSWVPLAHPIEIDPTLYSAAPTAFLPLGDFPDDGLRVGARLASLAHERLREGLLHTHALMAFENSRAAEASGEELEGFSPETFFGMFSTFDTDPSAGWFWHGRPLLGPDHLRSAWHKYMERQEAAGVFADDGTDRGPNSVRSDMLRSLLQRVCEETAKELQPPMPRRDPDDVVPTQTDLWVVAALSEFARASRTGTAREFVGRLVDHEWPEQRVLASLGFLLRLAPELFFYFLLLWELANVRGRQSGS